MASEDCPPVAVSRRIDASADRVFRILTDPAQHPRFDGSGMVRGAVSTDRISGVGDVFVMAMHYPALGDYEMNNHVVEYVPNRRVGWEPEAGRGHPNGGSADARWGQRWVFDLAPDGPDATVVTESYDCARIPAAERASMDDGRVWIDGMAATLTRLAALVV